ncbi:MAG: imidazole glycerol phosphate synthase subunit HisH [Clostridiales bacterium]
MISIVDYGMGNLKSVYKAFEYIGQKAKVTSDISEILKSEAVILPGVGAFGDSMENLNRLNLTETIKEYIYTKKPFLGICMGLQLLFEESSESKNIKGLGIFKEKLVRFPKKMGYKVPHMGWNSIKIVKNSPLFKNIDNSSYVYFVHSYYVKGEFEYVCAESDYIVPIGAAVNKDNVFATQFHPEKSGEMGIEILRNFVNLI